MSLIDQANTICVRLCPVGSLRKLWERISKTTGLKIRPVLSAARLPILTMCGDGLMHHAGQTDLALCKRPNSHGGTKRSATQGQATANGVQRHFTLICFVRGRGSSPARTVREIRHVCTVNESWRASPEVRRISTLKWMRQDANGVRKPRGTVCQGSGSPRT